VAEPRFVDDANEFLNELIDLRRQLHCNPETGLHLPQTQQRVLDALAGLDLEVTTGTGLSSVVAVLRGGRPGPAVLLRGDMDALPIREEVDLEYASTNGNMHACGHDMHTAGLVGAARVLVKHRNELPGSVIFMFQPGEENPGGAAPMIAEGLLDAAGVPVVGAFAIHVSAAPRGVFMVKPGTVLASRSELRITVHGRGGHSSRPHQTVDPIAPLVEIAGALNTMATRSFDALDPVVLSVTQLAGSEAVNTIPSSASLGASIRTLSARSLELVRTRVHELADGIAAAHRCEAEVDFRVDYPVTTNAPDEARRTIAVLSEQFGGDRVVERTAPQMGSEDFSFVLDEVSGTFVSLGATPEGVDAADAWNHSPRVQFDDSLLAEQSAALANLAWQRLAREARR
jgi:amidohydrolase